MHDAAAAAGGAALALRHLTVMLDSIEATEEDPDTVVYNLLLDGDHALKLITDQLTPSIQPGGRQKAVLIPIFLMLILLFKLMEILVLLLVLLK